MTPDELRKDADLVEQRRRHGSYAVMRLRQAADEIERRDEKANKAVDAITKEVDDYRCLCFGEYETLSGSASTEAWGKVLASERILEIVDRITGSKS